MDVQRYNKAIMTLVGSGIVLTLKHFGIVPDEVFVDAISVVILAGLVYQVPNKK